MKTIKLLSTLVIATFTSLQLNAQNQGIGAPAHADGINNSGNNVRLVLNGGFETGFTGITTAMTFGSGSEYSSTNSSTSGYLGYNWQKSGSSSTIGFSSTNRLTTARANTGTSQNLGGQFRASVTAVSGTNPYEMAGVYGDIRSATWNGFTTNGGFAGAIVGIDKVNGRETYAGYFDGKGYFSNRVGIGISTPASMLHVKNQGATNPNGAPGNWAAKIENNVDTPNENGLFVANRWGLNNSTILEVASYWNGSTEAYTPVLTVLGSRQVTIGTVDKTKIGSHKLAVDGSIICEELKVELAANWPDYVFGTKYNLKTIKELEAYIQKNNHLPGVPSEAEVKEKGIAVSEMLKIQMEKIEELTLYIIEQEKRITELEAKK